MGNGNVLVIGNSGVGKSTLINAVLGKDVAMASWGKPGTGHLDIYGDENDPFRVIDTIGFEPSFIKQRHAIGAVKKWCRESAEKEGEDTQINVIWFCVDGVAKRLFPETIQSMIKATSLYKSVPVIVVITKSFSDIDREGNIKMVREAFAGKKSHEARLRGVIPVVARAYPINESTVISPCGIAELIEATNDLLPEGKQAAKKDINDFILGRKRAMAQGVIAPSIVAGAAVGALPIPIADAAILGAVETAEVSAIARIYGIGDDEDEKKIIDTIVNVGTVGVAAKGAIGMLKAVPGINIPAEILNTVVAAGFVAALGEGCAYAFERIYIGEKDVADIEWVRKLMEAQLSNEFVDKLVEAIGQLGDKIDAKTIAKIVADIFLAANEMKAVK